MKKRHYAACYIAALAWSAAVAAAAETSPAEVLMRVAAKVLERQAALPNYTCVETVTRDYYQSVAATPPKACAALTAPAKDAAVVLPPLLWTMTDRLRLDVTITQPGEIYSWVGASKFDGGIDQVVTQGPIATGVFGALLGVVFKQEVKTFHFSKYLLEGGRGLMEYSFEVSKEYSQYQVKAGNSWVHAAYSGTLQVDQETDEVVRLTLLTAELPPDTGSCQTNTTMEFSVTRIGDRRFLLPKGAWQHFVRRTGEEVENTISLSSCREYVGESTVSFSEAPEAAGGNGRKTSPRVQLPAGLPFTLELTAPISTDTAAAGDPFGARLVSALRDKSGKTLAPALALVEGRVTLVEMRRTAPHGAVLMLKPMTVEIGGVKTPLAAVRRAGLAPRGKLPLSWERNSGIFPLSGEHAEIEAGFRSDWQTVAASDATQGAK